MDSALESGGVLDLPEDEAHHVLKVLRGRTGDPVEIVDGAGRLFSAELRGGRTAAVLEESAAGGAEVEVTLYQAVPKGGRMDLVVEKATEVGATTIVPLLSERGVVNPREGKVRRWRRVAEAAARQSLRLRVPRVGEPVAFEEAVLKVGETGVLLHNAPDLQPVEEVVESPARLFVGPEGGWSEDELRLAEEAGIAFGALGPNRLRSETAGIVAVARASAALESRVRP
ncbi:MAG TPA: RsmE family RNA methyltransferase [Rubrobacter sp.]